MMKTIYAVIVFLFVANCTVLIWMTILPGESMLVEYVLSDEAVQERARMVKEGVSDDSQFMEMALKSCRDRCRRYRWSSFAASTVLFLDTFFVFVVGACVCMNRQMRDDCDIEQASPGGATEGDDT